MEERCSLQAGKLIRPLSFSSKVRCKGYSLPLERAITDFGADIAFGKVGEKMKEHYGIEGSSSMVRLITQKHASKIAKLKKKRLVKKQSLLVKQMGVWYPLWR
ncbi:hypothetical protein [Neochlamydia sp. S13]|uniref:hypothetical protein n=1 Tax=Neochlamydia sp. S13 TaxID=1353976 RepID=UPI0005A676D2|nr:hypothetical protein [Neochlamydia sp. S13]BBI17161.1 Uncharacterized protein NCS13_1_0966 [Neochlamydia sp. S13]